MKKTCDTSSCCCHKPEWGLWFLRMGVAVLFFFPGLSKLMDGSGFQGMLGTMTGLTGTMLLVLFWLVVIFEFFGAIVVLLGKLLPKMIYKIVLIAQGIIMAVALFMVVIPAADMMNVYFHILAITAILALILTKPMCPIGVSGYACEKK